MTSTRNKTPTQNRKTYNSVAQHGLITEPHNGIFATLRPIPDVGNWQRKQPLNNNEDIFENKRKTNTNAMRNFWKQKKKIILWLVKIRSCGEASVLKVM